MKTLVALSITWVVLALMTLYFVVEHESTLLAAIVAWIGGIITYRLCELLYVQYTKYFPEEPED